MEHLDGEPVSPAVRPTIATWSGLRDFMGAAAWVAGWALGIALAVGIAILLAVSLFRWIVD